jgi:hypothetical protein
MQAHTMGENLYKPPGEPDAVEILPVRFGGGQLEKYRKVTRWLSTLLLFFGFGGRRLFAPVTPVVSKMLFHVLCLV